MYFHDIDRNKYTLYLKCRELCPAQDRCSLNVDITIVNIINGAIREKV
jgi:hypothetical protein